MRPLRRVILRILCITAMLVGGLTFAAGTAQAAVPDRWGFAFVNTNSGVPNLSYQAGSWPGGFNVTVTPGVVGQVFVKFPQIGASSSTANSGVVHVTATSQTAEWCQVQKYWSAGVDEIVAVRCYHYGGAPLFTPFSIVFSESTGPLPAPKAFGYVGWDGSAITTQYNSALAANSVVPTSTGVWTVVLPGLGSSGIAGNIQVTAVDSTNAARCKVGAWAPSTGQQKIQVRCHDATNVPFNTGWTLTYQRERAITGAAIPPKNFAYTFDNSPANPGPYAPAPAAINYNSQLAVNTVQTAGPGQRLVKFPIVGVLPNNVQVTAFGPGAEFCNLVTLWGTSGGDALVRNVICYNGTTRVDQPSLVTYTSAF
ncbi:hypothetical protein N5079_34605 [Planotetraspora sp. A-T 1434]|uniref:hypothetical protein n=1 Tax=Planotetraspora sp. A-T 1434 TaxID=2979219 RepID=UPI0021C049BC|nr:hypothetical protein [Planotetraspora sp. A-T 1434]MCT9935347.1 hypothetical protein [Planotetraspora sp. A-T 1434]